MSHPYERMVGLLFLLFLLVVDGNEQLLAGVYAKLGVDVAHVVVGQGEIDLPGVLHCEQLTYRGGSYVTCDRGFGARGARPFG